jgi:DNA-binding transcriptional regulator YdaS (Cro superfamily)
MRTKRNNIKGLRAGADGAANAMTPQQAYLRALTLFGSEARLAVAAGYTASAFSRARREGKWTAEMAVSIEAATGGRVKRKWLRPDLFGPTAKPIDHPWTGPKPSYRSSRRAGSTADDSTTVRGARAVAEGVTEYFGEMRPAKERGGKPFSERRAK